jgi:cob(I)alamin adenosyltransferase
MNLKLIQGQFQATDLLTILTQLVEVKIKYHESQIAKNSNEEDIKSRESKIKFLQNELMEARNFILQQNGNIQVEATIQMTSNK